MPIAILCPECRKPLGVPDDALDKSIRCPLCQTTFDGRDAPVQRFAIPTPLPETERRELPEPASEAITPEPVPISVAEEDEVPPCVIPVATPARRPESRRVPERRERVPVKRRTPGRPWYLFLFAFLPLGMVLVTLSGAWGSGQNYDKALGIGLGVGFALACVGLFFAVVRLPVVLRVLATLALNGLGYLAALSFAVYTLFIAPPLPLTESDWKDFSSAAGQFSVRMPGTPKPQTQNVQVPMVGNVTCHLFGVERNRDTLAYFVAYTDYPVLPQLMNAQQALAGARDGAAGNIGGRVVHEKEIWLDGHPGLEVELTSTRATMVCRYYLVRSRLYQLMIVSTKGVPPAADVRKFFESFKPTGQQPVVGGKPPPPPPQPANGMPEVPRPWHQPAGRPLPAATSLPGLLGYWKFDEPNNVQVNDASGKGNHAMRRGARRVNGLLNGSLRCNGDGDYCDYGNGPAFNFAARSPFTFAGWVQTFRDEGTVFSQRNSRDGSPVIDLTIEGGQLVALVRGDGNEFGQHAQIIGRPVNDGRWHHFALTRNAGDTIELFLDGVSQGKSAAPNAGGAITTDLRAIGCERIWARDNHGATKRRHLQGWVDEFCIYNRQLRDIDIKALAGLVPAPPPEPPPAVVLREPGRPYVIYRGGDDRVAGLAFTPDGQTLVVAREAGTIQLWNAAGGGVEWTFPERNPHLPPFAVRSLSLASDGRLAATASRNGVIQIWDLGGRRQDSFTREAAGGLAEQAIVRLQPKGSLIACGLERPTLTLWGTEPVSPKSLLAGHKDKVTALAFSPDGLTLASGGHDKVRLWDMKTRKEAATLPADANTRAGPVSTLAFSPDGRQLAAGRLDRVLWIWDVGARKDYLVLNHAFPLRALAYSPDGSLLAAACTNGELSVWDPRTGELRARVLSAPIISGDALAFTPDGTRLAVVAGKDIHVWDIDKLLQQKPVNPPRPQIEMLPVAPRQVVRPVPPEPKKTAHDDMTLAARLEPFIAFAADPQAGAAFTTALDGTVREYAYPDLALRGRYRIDGQAYQAAYDGQRGLLYLAVCPAGTLKADPHAVRQRAAGQLRVYDLNRVPENRLSPPPELKPAAVLESDVNVADLLLSADGAYLYYLDMRDMQKPRAVRVDAARRERDGDLKLEPYTHLLRLAPDGKTLYAAASKEGQNLRVFGGAKPPPALIQVIDPSTFRLRRSVAVDYSPFDMAADNDGLLFLSAGHSHSPNGVVVDVELNGAVVGQLPQVTQNSFVRLAPGGGRLYFSRHPGTHHWAGSLALAADLNAEHREAGSYEPTRGGSPLGRSMFLTPDGRYLLFGTGTVLALAGTELAFVLSAPGWGADGPTRARGETASFDARVQRLAFRPHGQTLIFAGERGVVQYLDVTGEPRVLTALPPLKGGVTKVVVSRDGKWLACASLGEFVLWDGEGRVQHGGKTVKPINDLDFAPDGQTLFLNIGGWLTHWDLKTHQEKPAFANTNGLYCCTYSPDGKLLAVGDREGKVRLLDTATEAVRVTCSDHAEDVLRVAFAPDGKRLASAGRGGAVRLWEVSSGKLLAVLEGHAGDVRSLSFSADGKLLASGSADNTARVWDVDKGRTVALLRAHRPGAATLGHVAVFSPDGKTLAAGGQGLRLWDVARLLDPKAGPDVPLPPRAPAEPPHLGAGFIDRVQGELKPQPGKLDPLLGLAVAPGKGAALVTTADGMLHRYAYPDFKAEGKYKLAGVAHQVALDPERGLLYAATSERGSLKLGVPYTRIHGYGTVVVYDVKAVLEGKAETGSELKPEVLEQGVSVTHLFLSPVGARLYYLDVKDPKKPRLGRIDTGTRKPDRELELAAWTDVIALTPDGKTLYAAGSIHGHHSEVNRLNEGVFQEIDADRLEMRQTLKLPIDPHDLAPTNEGIVYVSPSSGQHPPLYVVDMKRKGQVVARVAGPSALAYVKLSPDGKRLYLANQAVTPASFEAWVLPENWSRPPKKDDVRFSADAKYGMEFFVTPDGKFLVGKNGARYSLISAVP